MKKTLFLFLYLFLALSLSAQTITIQKPQNNAQWVIGGNYTIEWTHSGFSNPQNINITLRLRDDNGGVCLIATLPLMSNAFLWHTASCTGLVPGTYHVRFRTSPDPEIRKNSGNFTFLDPRADLKIDQAKTAPKKLYIGDTATCQMVIRNAGYTETPSITSTLKITGPTGFGTNLVTFNVKPMAPGTFFTHSETYKCKKAGYYKHLMTLDTNNDCNESNEGNNTKTFYATALPLPDLIACVRNGGKTNIFKTKKVWATIKNRGQVPSRPCTLRFYIKANGAKKFPVPALNPGEERVYYREPSWNSSGSKRMEVIADYHNDVKEIFENNNTVTGEIYVKKPRADYFRGGLTSKKCSANN